MIATCPSKHDVLCTGQNCFRRMMPPALRSAASDQIVLWPARRAHIVQTALSERDASDLQVALKHVRASKQEGGDYPEFDRILRGLHKPLDRAFSLSRNGSEVKFLSVLLTLTRVAQQRF